jgi:hypothetical protein
VIEKLGPGQKVLVRSMGRTVNGEIVTFDDFTARVRFEKSGKTRTIKRERIVGEQAIPKAQRLERLELVPRYERPAPRSPQVKMPRIEDPKYLAFVQSLPCCVCLASAPSEAHHFGPSGMALKADDRRTLPLCRRHHQEWHRSGRCKAYERVETERIFYRAQVDALLAYDRQMS